MKTRLLIISGIIVVITVIVGMSVVSPSINNFDDFVYQLKEPSDRTESEKIEFMGMCAYVGAKLLSDHDLQEIQNSPHQTPIKFLNFTDEHLSQVPVLKEIVHKLESSEFPLNDRGYVTVTADELQNIKDYLLSKSHLRILSPYIVVDGNLYTINGMISYPIDPNGESLNVQFGGSFEDRKGDFTEEELQKNPAKRYVILTEGDLEEIKPITDAIEQVGTWEMSIRESKDVGDAIQREVMSFIESESIRQMGPEPENQTSSFYYNGNYYNSQFVIC